MRHKRNRLTEANLTNKYIRTKKLVGLFLTVLLMLSSILSGCGKIDTETQIVLTAGFAKDVVFKIEDVTCTVPEIMVYLTNIQNQYEGIYGDQIWDTKIKGVTLENNIKEVALSRMAQVKTLTLLARERGIELDDSEQAKVDEIANMYFDSISQSEIDAMQIDVEVIKKLYGEYALSTKVYESIIKDINPEISDDEARTITVQHIYFKTFAYDDDGNKICYDEIHKTEARDRADYVLLLLEEGGDFEKFAREYSDDEEITISFGKGEKELAFENAAFALGKDELSEIVETDYGYEIIKCLSTFNREVTDENKIKIVEKRKQEAFTQEYEDFAKQVTKNINQPLWDTITFVQGEDIVTHDFFEVFDKNY